MRAATVAVGPGVLPAPIELGSDAAGEATESRLIVVTGIVPKKPTKGSGGDLTLSLERTGAPTLKVLADLSSGVPSTAFEAGGTYRLTGIVGQRATHTGALDGYRLWIRDVADVVRIAGPAATPSPTPRSTPTPHATPTPRPSTTPSPRPTASSSLPVIAIRTAKTRLGQAVAVVAVVTAGSTLLDSTGRRIVVQDASGGIEVHLPKDVVAPPIGTRLRVEGKVGTAYGAPRIDATGVDRQGTTAPPVPTVLRASLSEAQEWRLASIHGRVDSVHKLGDRWRAELRVGTHLLVVLGQSGAHIPSTALIEGRDATVVGIVRRPYPTATDRRFALLPRGTSDIRLGNAPAGTPGATAGANGGTGRPTTSARPGPTEPDDSRVASSGTPANAGSVADADVTELASLTGHTVRIGGLVTELRPDGFRLDDGTAVGTVVLRGPAADLVALVEPGDAINATGSVETAPAGPILVVADPAGLVLAGSPSTSPAAGTSAPAAGSDVAASSGDDAASGPIGVRRRAALAPFPGDGAAGALGLGALAGLTAASLLVTFLRRGAVRRRLTDRLPAGLATGLRTAFSTAAAAVGVPRSGGRTATPPAPSTAEHDPRSADSA